MRPNSTKKPRCGTLAIRGSVRWARQCGNSAESQAIATVTGQHGNTADTHIGRFMLVLLGVERFQENVPAGGPGRGERNGRVGQWSVEYARCRPEALLMVSLPGPSVPPWRAAGKQSNQKDEHPFHGTFKKSKRQPCAAGNSTGPKQSEAFAPHV